MQIIKGVIFKVDKSKQKKIYPCYVCKQPLQTPHSEYVKLCQPCGEFNAAKKLAIHDLSGWTALVTGGRTKIGYYTALRLLRDGARVIVTSRFPYDAYQRYAQESDFVLWQDRIHIYGLDFRYIDRVEQFAHILGQEFAAIDIVINNAAQTVRMPESEYQMLALNEPVLKRQLAGQPSLQLPSEAVVADLIPSAESLHDNQQHLIPYEAQLINNPSAEHSSWIAESGEISLYEMLEVQLINVTAPFLLNTRCKPAMLRSSKRNRFIVNVTSIEGKFNMKRKGKNHVHTNMSKASLNMMTLTMAKEYRKHRIFITSVDPGWISSLFPDKLKGKSTVEVPLQCEDAAARICDPIYIGKDQDKPATGVYFKDYQQVDW